MIYSINNISEEQIMVIAKALDTYCRLGLLQLDHAIIDDIRFGENFDFTKNLTAIDNHITEIKRLIIQNNSKESIKEASLLGDLRGWSLGITSDGVPENALRAYEMSKAIYHKRWKENPPKHYSVDGNEGLKLTSDMSIVVESESERQVKIKNILNDAV